MTDVAPRTGEVEYPTSDGKPMAESDKHADLMVYLKEALRAFFRDRPEVYVSGNNFLYWEEGNPRACVSPDVYVVFGPGMRQRDCYKAWEEGGRLPDVVVEITSKKTRREDVRDKLPKYRDTLQVPEYFLFDPTGDYLRPRLQGYRLREGEYMPMELVEGRLHSDLLGLDLVQKGSELRLYDPAKGEWLLTPQELFRAREEERQRAEQEAQRAEQEAQRAGEQSRRAEAAEAEAARLRAELEALRNRLAGGGEGQA